MALISRLVICPFNGLRWANSQSESPKGLGRPTELSFERSLLFGEYAMDITSAFFIYRLLVFGSDLILFKFIKLVVYRVLK